MKRIGILGGSFNPIHAGHIRIARAAQRELQLDAVLVIPAQESPFKVGLSGTAQRGGLDAAMRWELVQVACAPHPGLVPCDMELKRGGVSYAIDTVREIARRNPGARLFFIIGEDAVPGLPRWKQYDALRRLVTFRVYPRTRESSTAIRAALARGRFPRVLLGAPVAARLRERLWGKVRIEMTGRIPRDFNLTRAALQAAAEKFAAFSRARVPENGPWFEVCVHLIRDRESAACHRAIMNVAGATDVITQAYAAIPPEPAGVRGELFVNVDQARRAAPQRRGWSIARELLLYVAHGMDHLSGANDFAPQDYARMRRRELGWLKRL